MNIINFGIIIIIILLLPTFFSDLDETYRVGAPNQKNSPPKIFLTLTLIQGHRVKKTENSQNFECKYIKL